MSDSIWKKEISFSRKPKAAKPAGEPSGSIWKKEISFSRRRRDADSDPSPPAPPLTPWPTAAVAPQQPPYAVPAQPQPHQMQPPVTPVYPAPPQFAPQPPAAWPTPPAPVSAWPPPQAVPEPQPPFTSQPAPAAPAPPQPPAPWPAEAAAGPVSSWPPPQAAPEPQPPFTPQPVPVPQAPVAAEPAWPAQAVPEGVSSWPPPQPAPEPPPSLVPPSAPVAPVPVPAQPVWPTQEIPAAPVQPVPLPPVAADSGWPAEAAHGHVSSWPPPQPAPEPSYEVAPPQHSFAPPQAPPQPVYETVPPQPWPAAPEHPTPAQGADSFPPVSPVESAHVPTAAIPEAPTSVVETPAARPTPFWRKELSLKRAPKAPKTPKPKRSRSATSSSGRKAKRVVGLKVGASQLAAACVATNGTVELQQVARQPLEPGVVVNGELRDPEALAEALKSFFSRNKLPKNNVRLGLATSRIGVRVIDIGGIDDQKQLDNAVRFRAQEALPIPLDEAVLDYHVVGESVDDEGQPTQRVVLVVAYRELVERYAEACRKAGIGLMGVDVEAFALLRALVEPRQQSDAEVATVAIAIGHDRSTFAVSDGRICEFTRVLAWGGSTLNIAVARALDLAPSEVEGFKHLLSLEPTPPPAGVPPEQYALAVDAVRKQVQAFARELVSSLQFYQHQPGSLAIGEVVLTGGTAMLAGLATELQQLIGVRVRVGDPLARLTVAKKVKPDQQFGSLAVAIGLGIED
jgi:type IV pilus assembly protein PilM